MNFVGHIHIAGHAIDRHVSDDASAVDRDRFLFGAALPDFATIGRFQLEGDPADASVAAGVALHHATDSAFHGSDWFTDHSRAVRRDLEFRGVNRGAARACAHVGVELLLDGHLLASHPPLRTQSQRVLGLAEDHELELSGLVAHERRDEWVRHLDRISTWPLPDDYHRPEAVARRLHRILLRRRRLAFDEEQIPVVAQSLADHAPALTTGIVGMVDAVATELAA